MIKKFFKKLAKALSWKTPEPPMPSPIEVAVPEKKFIAQYDVHQDGHRLFEYDPVADTIKEVKDAVRKVYANKVIYEIECRQGLIYVSALNKKNALKFLEKKGYRLQRLQHVYSEKRESL